MPKQSMQVDSGESAEISSDVMLGIIDSKELSF